MHSIIVLFLEFENEFLKKLLNATSLSICVCVSWSSIPFSIMKLLIINSEISDLSYSSFSKLVEKVRTCIILNRPKKASFCKSRNWGYL